jgi:diguanylate cyclase (GGDEF)-like protein
VTTPETHLPELPPVQRMQEIQEELRRIERRDWWLWWAAVIVMLLLTVGVVSMSFPGLMQLDHYLEEQMTLAVRGLVGLVLLFNTYSIYQQVMNKKLRKQLNEQLTLMIQLETRAETFHKLAMNDPLTGLSNRRFATSRLAAEADRSRRYGHPLTVVVMDLDLFKETNDRYGHAAGDLVLKEFGARLNSIVRVSDVAARVGGDEFLILLPECPESSVDALLERLGTPEVQYNGHRIPITYSVGWAGYRPGERPERLLDRADRALYADKRARKEKLNGDRSFAPPRK